MNKVIKMEAYNGNEIIKQIQEYYRKYREITIKKFNKIYKFSIL